MLRRYAKPRMLQLESAEPDVGYLSLVRLNRISYKGSTLTDIHRHTRYLAVIVVLLLGAAFGITPSRSATPAAVMTPRSYLPALHGPPISAEPEWLQLVNAYRRAAGVPEVSEVISLSDQCWQHARYVAENDDLTHSQNASRPYASADGQRCAANANVWMGGAGSNPFWQINHAIDSWAHSVGHRMWLLYPTTPAFGFGFYTDSDTNRAGAALDVLSQLKTSTDAAYNGWPVRYPAANQGGIPATNYPITLGWPYFGPTPTIGSTSLRIENGPPLGHSSSTALPAGHKGILITPNAALPANTIFVVGVSGIYNATPFTFTWRFSTGSSNLNTQSADPAALDHPAPALALDE